MVNFSKMLVVCAAVWSICNGYCCQVVTHLRSETKIQEGITDLRVTGRIPDSNWSKLKFYPKLEKLSLKGTVVCGTPGNSLQGKWRNFFSVLSCLSIKELDLYNQFLEDKYLEYLPTSVKTLDLSYVNGITKDGVIHFLKDRDLTIITSDPTFRKEDFINSKIRILLRR